MLLWHNFVDSFGWRVKVLLLMALQKSKYCVYIYIHRSGHGGGRARDQLSILIYINICTHFCGCLARIQPSPVFLNHITSAVPSFAPAHPAEKQGNTSQTKTQGPGITTRGAAMSTRNFSLKSCLWNFILVVGFCTTNPYNYNDLREFSYLQQANKIQHFTTVNDLDVEHRSIVLENEHIYIRQIPWVCPERNAAKTTVSSSINQIKSNQVKSSQIKQSNQSTNQWTSQSINQSTNQPINQSSNQSINQPINQSINQSINRSIT